MMPIDPRREIRAPLARLLALAALGANPGVAVAQENGEEAKRSVSATRLNGSDGIELNGRLDELFWRRAERATGFRQEEPSEGAAPTESTVVHIAYDEDNLYIGVQLYDSDPAGILAYQKERDAGLGTDDRFMWILDTFLDGRTGYFFEINPAGLMGDGLIGGGGGGGGGGGFFGVNKSWDGIWEARVQRGDSGWSAEIRIPFRTLNFNPGQDTWGINFQRTVRRKNEEMRWTGYRRNQSFTRPVHAGQLTGLQGMSQGVGLEVTPYALAGWRNDTTSGDPNDYTGDGGLDLTYNVTPSLRAALTVNTDFAEVEVDQRRVNLTRFPLFFPERRDFFLEGSGVFSFAQRNGVTPYFSRNIGLAEGQPVPITYGGRLGGQTGRYELGFVQVHTNDDRALSSDGELLDIPSEDFTVARIKRTLFEQSSIGAIYTRRATSADRDGVAPPDRHTVGVDLDLFTSKFLGDKNFQFEAFFVGHTDPATDGTASFGDLTARGIRINYPNDIWRVHTSYRELGDEFDPALGFTRRNGFRRVQPTVTFAPRPRQLLDIRQMEFQLQFEYLMNIDWRLETRKTDFKLLGLRFNSGDRLDFEVTQLFERLDDGFEIRDQIVIPAGRYNTISWQASGRTAGRRVVSGNFRLSGGEFWSGDRWEYEIGATVRPMAGLSFRTEYERNDVNLPEGDFTTNLVRVESGWHASPWASLNWNVQYDDVSEVLGLFARFRWILRPGSDLFLVYTQNWQNMNDPLGRTRFRSLSRGATTKINYTHRF